MLAKDVERHLVIRYDRDCMRPMTAEARELEALIEFRLGRTPRTQIDWEPECLLIVDNHRMVHARGKGIRLDTNRVLKRILIGGT
jgi:L-asparagine oxygenase